MVTKAKLSVDVSTNTGQFESGLKRADRAMLNSQRAWSRSLGSSRLAFGQLTDQVFNFRSALGGILSGAGMVAFTRASLNMADSIKDLSNQLGLSTRDVQVYREVFRQAGVDQDAFASSISILNRRIADGKTPYTSTSQAILGYADRIKNAATGVERAAIANEGFGKSGAANIPVLIQGSAAIEQQARALESYGGVLSDTTINQAAAFNDQLDTLFFVLKAAAAEGLLSGFASDGQKIKDVYSDPELVKGVQDFTTVLGGLVSFILRNLPEATAVLSVFAAAAAGAATGAGIGSIVPGVGTAIGGAAGALVGGAGAFAAFTPTLANRALGGKGASGAMTPIDPSTGQAVGYTPTGGSDETLDKMQARRKVVQGLISDLQLEADKVRAQVELYGMKDSYVDRVLKKQQIEARLAGEGIKLTAKQREEMELLLDNIAQQEAALEKLEEQKKKDAEADKRRQDAIEQLGFTFSSAFEDAIVGGNKLSDVLRGLLQDVIKLAVRMSITQPMASGISGLIGGDGGGLFSSLLGSQGAFSRLLQTGSTSFVGPLPQFAEGGYLGAGKFGIAGEAGPELIHGGRSGATIISNKDLGGGGGNNFYIDSRGADSTQIRILEAKLNAMAGKGVVEQRVIEAMQRGKI